MKIAIVSITRTHLLNLAIALDKKEDVDVVFYTLTPRSRLRRYGYKGKIVSCFLPIGVLLFLTKAFTRRLPFKCRLIIGHKFRKWFDQYISLLIKPCDILVAANGDAYYTTQKLNKICKPISICDQGAVHINEQDKSYKEKGVYINPWNTVNLINHYNISNYIMTASEHMKETDLINGIEKGKLLYNPYGVDLDVFKTDNTVKKGYDVAFVGNWGIIKGCDMLVDACKKEGFSLLHVGVIGDFPFPNSPTITHVDFVPEKRLPFYLSQAKVFILPSRNEGFGMVLLQAAACGLPVVGSSRTGMNDLINLLNQPQGCFMIEEPLSADTISIALRKAVDYANSVSTEEHRQYEYRDNLSWSAYGDRYYNILKELSK